MYTLAIPHTAFLAISASFLASSAFAQSVPSPASPRTSDQSALLGPDPLGACCLPNNGGCIHTFLSECNNQGGSWQGDGMQCFFGICDIGQCCTYIGSGQTSCVMSTAIECLSIYGGYAWNPAATCLDPCSPWGVCCYNTGLCAVTSQSTCLFNGDAVWTAFEDCSSFTCNYPTGACCVNGACIQTTEHNCVFNLAGEFHGFTSDCSNPDECTLGSCCIPGQSCTVTTISTCTIIGGSWQNGDCSSPCPPYGACCYGNSGPAGKGGNFYCALEFQADCIANGGIFQGDGTDCFSSPCSGACCFGTACFVMSLDDCGFARGLYLGHDIPCSSNSCCGGACPADVAPAGGDGVVNIDDLTAVILNWSSAGPDGDVNCDSTVNIDDLTAIILAWGACP